MVPPWWCHARCVCTATIVGRIGGRYESRPEPSHAQHTCERLAIMRVRPRAPNVSARALRRTCHSAGACGRCDWRVRWHGCRRMLSVRTLVRQHDGRRCCGSPCGHACVVACGGVRWVCGGLCWAGMTDVWGARGWAVCVCVCVCVRARALRTCMCAHVWAPRQVCAPRQRPFASTRHTSFT